MRILIDIGHPAHVHYFRNFHAEMDARGHELAVTARNKEMTHALLDGYGIKYVSRGRGGDSVAGKLAYLPLGAARVLGSALDFRPDVLLSFSSPYAAHAAALLRRPHVAFDDTEHAWLGRLLYAPFTRAILSPRSYRGRMGRRHRRFDGYLELLYLHPNRFTPDAEVVRAAGVDPEQPYTMVRFVSWSANHDIGAGGLSRVSKRRAVAELARRGRVLISSEEPLPDDLEPHRMCIDPTHVHHFLAFAGLLFGESATMASESGVLGTPAVFIDRVGRGYTEELEDRYGLVYNFGTSPASQTAAIERAAALMDDPHTAELHQARREDLLNTTVDPNAVLIETVESVVAG